MSECYKDFCRLCAQKDEFLKDLFDESNKNVLKLIQDFIQLIVYENDDLPTKICLNCEEKMVSFQLFVLECYKTQEMLKKLYKSVAQIKLEYIPQDVPVPCIKEEVEVKDELTAEDIVSALNNEGTLAELEVYDDLPSGDDDDIYLDDIAIASLKQIKRRKVEKKEKTTEDIKQFNDLLIKPNLKEDVEVKDELTAEDIVSALNNEGTLAELEVYDDLPSGDDDDIYLDDIAIASLKQIKRRKVEKKEKTTEDIKQFNDLLIKPNLKEDVEVKDEMTAEDIVSAHNNEGNLAELEVYDELSSGDDDDYLDDIAIASHKQIKRRKVEKKEKTTEDIKQFNDLLIKPNLKEDVEVKDEMTAEDIVSAHNNEGNLAELEVYDELSSGDDDDDYLDDIAIASHKQIKRRKVEKKEKTTEDIKQFNDLLIKPNLKEDVEVKDEITAEDIVSALNNEGTLAELEVYDDLPSGDDDDDDDYSDDIPIASLKQIKSRKVERKEKTSEVIKQFNDLLRKPTCNLKIKDFVKFDCKICGRSFKTWGILSYHYIRGHKRKPSVFCLCGFEISSRSVLFKHVSEHKEESKKIRKAERVKEFQDSEYAHFNVKDFVSFECPQCQKVCSSWYTLRGHCENEHKISPFVNCSCGIVLKSHSAMYRHVKEHKYPNVFACDKCPRITRSIAALNNHKMRHVPKSERKFCCSSCDKILKTKHALKSHERSHIPIENRKIYNCDVCNMKFTTSKSASSHKRVVHDKIKAYMCDLCGYMCATNGELHQHRAIHSDDKPFTCRKCGKPFKTYRKLKMHMDTHERSYVCFICQRVLNSRDSLRRHLLVHADKCRHVCSYCNKAFKLKQTLKVHMHRHTGDKPLTCKWCEKRFAYWSSLRKHRLSAHPDKVVSHADYHAHSFHVTDQQNYVKDDVQTVNVPVTKNEVETMFTTRSSASSHKRVVQDKIKAYLCDLCGYACGTNGELRQHRAIHSDDKPFTCRKCGKPFKTYTDLKIHMDTHEETSYVCFICKRVLNSRHTLREHLLVHEDKCRHVCSYCNKAFNRKQKLKVHMYTHTGVKPLTCKWCEERFFYTRTLRLHQLRAHPDNVASQKYVKDDVQKVNMPVIKNEVETM